MTGRLGDNASGLGFALLSTYVGCGARHVVPSPRPQFHNPRRDPQAEEEGLDDKDDNGRGPVVRVYGPHRARGIAVAEENTVAD